MVRWRNLKLIFLRELRDQIRDRRTLMMIVVLPLLMYPALGIGMVQLTLLFAEQPRRVVIAGDEQLPGLPLPQLLEKDRFSAALFSKPEHASHLAVITESSLRSKAELKTPDEEATVLLAQIDQIREKLPQRERIEAELADLEEKEDEQSNARREQLLSELEAMNRELGPIFAAAKIQALVVFPGKVWDKFGGSQSNISRSQFGIRGGG